jgi:hypothetical protein
VFTQEFLIVPLDAEYSGILGFDVLRHTEANVDLRTSTLVLGRKRYQLSEQEIERCQLVRRQYCLLQGASETGLINPEAFPDEQVEVPIPGLSQTLIAGTLWLTGHSSSSDCLRDR